MNNAAIEALLTFATQHNELAFAHVCTAALAGEKWAIAWVTPVVRVWANSTMAARRYRLSLAAIHSTNTGLRLSLGKLASVRGVVRP